MRAALKRAPIAGRSEKLFAVFAKGDAASLRSVDVWVTELEQLDRVHVVVRVSEGEETEVAGAVFDDAERAADKAEALNTREGGARFVVREKKL
jgi:hypothetical protein